MLGVQGKKKRERVPTVVAARVCRVVGIALFPPRAGRANGSDMGNGGSIGAGAGAIGATKPKSLLVTVAERVPRVVGWVGAAAVRVGASPPPAPNESSKLV